VQIRTFLETYKPPKRNIPSTENLPLRDSCSLGTTLTGSVKIILSRKISQEPDAIQKTCKLKHFVCIKRTWSLKGRQHARRVMVHATHQPITSALAMYSRYRKVVLILKIRKYMSRIPCFVAPVMVYQRIAFAKATLW
jgi:hypothetical protein